MTDISTMTVYRASAGSGKTFTLAVKYIDLLLRDPLAYKNTLAVTFTNKATEEMKMRILSQLYGLWKGLADSDAYLSETMADTGLGEEQVRHNAGRALRFIVHDYNSFAIETIDSFFQRVLRNLARELDLTANLRVELNDKEVEQLAVDRLIANLTDTSEVLSWIITYIEDAINDDKSWNVISKIKKFGESIFNDDYKNHSQALEATLGNEDFFRSYRQELSRLEEQTKSKLAKYAERFEEILSDNALTVSDFSNGSRGACGYFIKLKKGDMDDSIFNKTAQDAAEKPEAWVKKSCQRPGCLNYEVAEQYLTPLLREAEECRSREARIALSAATTLRHLHQLRLLNVIKAEVNAINAESNRFLLSDTQTLLHAMMKESDAPFIFEKIGGQLRHIMIDEFQDTSTVQWNNFKKLLAESMSHEDSSNLIVGDVKQSIYRWRSGDWHLLHNIESEQLLQRGQMQTKTLDRNFRSESNIIHFNNEFFLRAAQSESRQLQEADVSSHHTVADIYSEPTLFQKSVRDTARGLVRIDFLPHDDYDDNTRSIIRQNILQLIHNGARQDSIAIIVRDNKNIKTLAETLQKEMPELTFVSDEAFHLDASRAVNIIVTAMRILSQPADELAKAQVLRLSGYSADTLLDRRHHLLALPLRDLSEELFAIFHLEEMSHEAAYVCAFNDQIDRYTQRNLPILEDFLSAWDESIHEKSVRGGFTEGIRLLTVHKSKGLEYDHVILPYCDWKLDLDSTLWCSTAVKPFGELPVIPLDWHSTKGTIYQADYDRERLERTIENLNMLYVAFTRAAKNLFVITRNNHGAANLRARTLYNTIAQLVADADTDEALRQRLPHMAIEGDFDDNLAASAFSCGTLFIEEKKAKASHNVFLQESTRIDVPVRPSEMSVEFRQSNQSKRFATPADADTTQQHYIDIGTVMHQLLSRIRTLADLDSAIRDFEQEGVVYTDDMNREKLTALVRQRVESPKVKRWFSADVEVYNECSILDINPLTGQLYELRPDRVVRDADEWTVIDFKFGSPRPEHQEQVARYMQQLRRMGHERVAGCLWYVYKNQIVDVIPTEQ